MVRKIVIVLLILSVFALLGLGYLQFANDSAYVLARNLPRYHQITAGDLTEQRFARLRDERLKALIITNQGQIVGKYAGREMQAGEILVNNGALLSELPPGRCFSSGRCLEEGQTAWEISFNEVDTVGGRVTLDDYIDIILIDDTNKKLTFFLQKMKPLEISGGKFLFGFTPEQVAVLRGMQGAGEFRMGLLLNQENNALQEQFKEYSMDYRQFSSDLFPLPTPTPTPVLSSVEGPETGGE